MRTTGALLPLTVWIAVASLGAQTNSSSLLSAVRGGDHAAVRTLLGQDIDVNLPSRDGTTALHWAAEQDNLEMAQLLIRAGATAQVTNRFGVSPLHAACLNGNASMIELMLEAGADPNTSLPGGETVLMTAARSGSTEALEVLMVHGASVNRTEDAAGQTALMWAAAEGHASAIRALLEGGARVQARSTSGLSAFLFAVREGQLDAVRELIAAGVDVDEVIQAEETEGSGSPARQGAVRHEGLSALGLAIANAHYDLAVMLVDAGADPNHDIIGWTPLHQLVFTRRPNPEAVVYAPSLTGRVDSIQLAEVLLAHGANVNAQMTDEACGAGGITQAGFSRPVQTDTRTFYLPCFDVFGNRNNMNRIGATPFLLAAKAADEEMMRFLASQGADPFLATVEGVTPLMAAAGVAIYKVGLSPGTNEEALEAVKVALELGGDVNTIDANRDTALHGAAIRGAPEIVQLLAEHGAKLDIVNKTGWSPLTIADGVPYTQTLVVSDETAVLLRQLFAQQGLAVPPKPTETTTGVAAAAVAKD